MGKHNGTAQTCFPNSDLDFLREGYCLLRVLSPILKSMSVRPDNGKLRLLLDDSRIVSDDIWDRLTKIVIEEFLCYYVSRIDGIDDDRRNRMEEIANWLAEHRGTI